MVARYLLSFVLCLAVSSDLPASPATESRLADHGVDDMRSVLNSGSKLELAKRVDRSVDQMVRLAVHELKSRGFTEDADDIRQGFDAKYRGHIEALVAKRDVLGLKEVGDWAPMSEWLSEVYTKLLNALGPELMEITHLEDIFYINYCIPVVFNFESIPDQMISPAEYKKHFVPLAGVCAFWSVSIACDVATWGSGYWLVCTPAGMLAKYSTVNYVAPPMSPNWYAFFYEE